MFGSSVHACLTRIRIDVAVSMLLRGVSVTETAAACGFASLSHFSRMFHSHTGISPKQYALGISPEYGRSPRATPCAPKARRKE
ncbi:MAG: helix-turn-helix domain-containing protein [Azoarcus sp.]|nr:helix-turn-helix domain-containing protein [Azoarcus sp.]